MEKAEIIVRQTDSILDQVGQGIEKIKQRAFELFTKRDPLLAAELDDWLAAERELSLPTIDVQQRDGKFEIEAALPGMEAGDIKVETTREELLITAEHGSVPAKAEGMLTQTTTQLFGAVHFPSPVDPSSVTADYRKGLLHVRATMAAPPTQKVELRA